MLDPFLKKMAKKLGLNYNIIKDKSRKNQAGGILDEG
jgi:hypothetical protein